MELKTYKEQILKVKNLIEKLEQGELSTSELTDLELNTRLLHERSIILKYNALAPNSNRFKEEKKEVEKEKEEKIDAPFDWNPSAEEVSENEPLQKLEEIIEKELEAQSETIIELTEEEMKVETPPSIQEIMNDLTEEVIEELREIEKTDTPAPADAANDDFVSKLDLSAHSFTMGTKLDSLIGAFGLNEKLRFINELFDGSSDAFNDAIKSLDAKSNLQEAYASINNLASQNSWESDEESVLEFVSFVNRRYA